MGIFFIMQRRLYENLERRIHSYCDNNIGKEALFYAFSNCWNFKIPAYKKDFRNSTERIVRDLIDRGILEEIKIPRQFNTPFVYYRILPHKRLVDEDENTLKRLACLN